MTRFASHDEIVATLADRIGTTLDGLMVAGLKLHVRLGVSNASVSRYIDVLFEDAEGDDIGDPCCIRISDHEARSYNRAGDYTIALVSDGRVVDGSEWVHVEDLEDDDGEYEGSEVDEDSVARAVGGAVAFAGRAAERSAAEAST